MLDELLCELQCPNMGVETQSLDSQHGMIRHDHLNANIIRSRTTLISRLKVVDILKFPGCLSEKKSAWELSFFSVRFLPWPWRFGSHPPTKRWRPHRRFHASLPLKNVNHKRLHGFSVGGRVGSPWKITSMAGIRKKNGVFFWYTTQCWWHWCLPYCYNVYSIATRTMTQKKNNRLVPEICSCTRSDVMSHV